MQKSFFSTAFLLILLNVLVKPFFLFGIDAQVQNQVGADEYGLYFSLLNFSFLFSMVLDVGITNYNTKNIAESPQLVYRYFGSVIGIRILLGLIYASITIGCGLLLNYSTKQLEILSLLTLNQFLAGMILYFRSNFAGLHWFKTDAFFSILDRLILIIICSVLLYSSWVEESFQIMWFVEAQTASYGTAAFIALLLSISQIGKPKVRIKKAFSLAILRRTAPFAMLTLLMMLYSRIDAVMIERLLPDGPYQAGIYAQGFRLLDAANIFALLIAGLLLPIFARKIKQKNLIESLLKSVASFMISVAIIIAISTSFFAAPILDLIYSYTTNYSYSVFSVIILSFVPMSATYVFGTLLTANGNLKELNKMALLGLMFNLVLNFILIPIIGAMGAAIATLLTQFFTALWQIWLVKKYFHLRINVKLIAKIVMLSLIGIVLSFFAQRHQELFNLIGFVGLVFVLMGITFLLKIFSVSDLKKKLRPME